MNESENFYTMGNINTIDTILSKRNMGECRGEGGRREKL